MIPSPRITSAHQLGHCSQDGLVEKHTEGHVSWKGYQIVEQVNHSYASESKPHMCPV